MDIKKILVSQPQPAVVEKGPFWQLVEQNKVVLDFKPFITTVSVPVKDFRKQKIDITAHTAVILTSKNSVDNYFRICEESRFSVPESMMYFCVSEAIALYLQKYTAYRKRKIFFGKSKFIDLVDLLLKYSTNNFLVPLSDPHKPEIPQLLTEAKLKFSVAILSSTEPVKFEDSLKITDYDMLLFYSPLEIQSLIGNFGEEAKKIKIAAFGIGTAQAAIEAGCNLVSLAPTAESPSMVMAVSKYLKEYKKLGDKVDLSYIDTAIEAASNQNQEAINKVKNVKPKRASSRKTTKA